LKFVAGIIRLKRDPPVLKRINHCENIEEELILPAEDEGDEEEGVVLERNIMEDAECRLRQPDNVDADLWTEVVRLNSYLGKGISNLDLSCFFRSGRILFP
jgi:hypothetical protein